MGEGYKCREDVFLHAEKISKIYPGTKALDEVSFDLLKGKANVLIGENGAGKSTLMDDSDAVFSRLGGVLKVHFLFPDVHLALIRLLDSGNQLCKGGFPPAVWSCNHHEFVVFYG